MSLFNLFSPRRSQKEIQRPRCPKCCDPTDKEYCSPCINLNSRLYLYDSADDYAYYLWYDCNDVNFYKKYRDLWLQKEFKKEEKKKIEEAKRQEKERRRMEKVKKKMIKELGLSSKEEKRSKVESTWKGIEWSDSLDRWEKRGKELGP